MRDVQLLYRDKLAERLGITPKERVSLKAVDIQIVPKTGDKHVLLAVSCLIDGGDLTKEQEGIFTEFLAEANITTLNILPEKPITS